MSVRKIGSGKWLVVVVANSGRSYRKIRRRHIIQGARRDAVNLEAKIRGEIERDSTSRLSIDDYASEWMAARKASIKPSTYTRHEQALRCHLLPEFGDWWLDAISPADVQAYVGARSKAGAAPHTVRNEIKTLGVMLRDALAGGLIGRDPTARVKLPTPEGYTDEHPNLLTVDQVRALLPAIPDRWRPLVYLLAFTGLRWGEASALRWEDIDDVRTVIRIRRSNSRGVAVVPKTRGSIRTIPYTPTIATILGERKSEGWIFPAANGELFRGWPLHKVIDRACAKANVPRITTHGLRRTFNDQARRVAAREVVKSLTGHSTDRMLEHYSRVDDDERARVIDLVAASGTEKSKS